MIASLIGVQVTGKIHEYSKKKLKEDNFQIIFPTFNNNLEVKSGSSLK